MRQAMRQAILQLFVVEDVRVFKIVAVIESFFSKILNKKHHYEVRTNPLDKY